MAKVKVTIIRPQQRRTFPKPPGSHSRFYWALFGAIVFGYFMMIATVPLWGIIILTLIVFGVLYLIFKDQK